MSSSSSTTAHRNVIPSEVGWQFVPQYYTFVNKQPERLHCFYTKKSTFIHGTEGEDEQPACCQAEIHAKITSLDFQNCKVFIHSVDAQSSADGGIIIQVIGEMSNRGGESVITQYKARLLTKNPFRAMAQICSDFLPC